MHRYFNTNVKEGNSGKTEDDNYRRVMDAPVSPDAQEFIDEILARTGEAPSKPNGSTNGKAGEATGEATGEAPNEAGEAQGEEGADPKSSRDARADRPANASSKDKASESPGEASVQSATDFLKFILPNAPWCLVAFDPNADKGSGPCGGITVQPDDPQREAKAQEWIDKHNGKHNIYYHINRLIPNLDTRKASKHDFVSAGCVQVDIDISKHADWNDAEQIKCIKDGILEDLRNYVDDPDYDDVTLPPTVTIHTGGGFQALWKLREPVPPSDFDLVEKRSRRIAENFATEDFKGDKCWNVDRIFRLPFTYNVLSEAKLACGRKVELAKVVEFNPSRVYGIERFALPEEDEFEGRQRGAKPIAAEHVTPLLEILKPILDGVSPDCDRFEWRDIILGFEDFFAGHEDALTQLHTWLKGSKKKYNPQELDKIWNWGKRAGTPKERVTIATFLHIAKDAKHEKIQKQPYHYPLAYLVENIENTKDKPTSAEFKDAMYAPLSADNVLKAALIKAYFPLEFQALKDALRAVGFKKLTPWEATIKAILKEVPNDAKQTPLDRLIRIAREAELAHTEDGQPIATVEQGGYKETYRVGTMAFFNWLNHRFYKETERGCDDKAYKQALNTVSAIALHEGAECKLHIRVGEHGGNHYLDLCNGRGEVVEMSADGWHTVQDAGIKFIRNNGMLPLPTPTRGAPMIPTLAKFRKLLNLSNRGEFTLFLSYMLQCISPFGPYPILNPKGVSSSAKTTISKVAKMFIDPDAAGLARKPKTSDDIFVSAFRRHIPAWENLSRIPNEFSDDFCAISTGTGYVKRKLYTDSDEMYIHVERPQIINGIADIIRRSDLINRAISFDLKEISPHRRKTKPYMENKLKTIHADVLGVLLDIYVYGLKHRKELKPNPFMHMAEFAELAVACEGAYNKRPLFVRAYKDNRAMLAQNVTEGDPIINAMFSVLNKNEGKWNGVCAELLTKLKNEPYVSLLDVETWPKDATRMSGWLTYNAGKLKALGINVRFKRERKEGYRDPQRVVYLELVEGEG